MRTPQQVIADNLARIEDRIAAAAHATNRDPASVKLVAVTKYVDAETAAYLVQAGCSTLGESRPQQLWEKAVSPGLKKVEWHLIGRLQRNKIRRTLPLARLIHSVDSDRLLTALNEHAAEVASTCNVLLEVNCSGEANKQGFTLEEVRTLLPEIARLKHVRVHGLMTMAPLDASEAITRQTFATLRQLRDELIPLAAAGIDLPELSMGMSGDFEAAIAEGATIVRIGSSLFDGLPHLPPPSQGGARGGI